MTNFVLDFPTKVYFGNHITLSALKEERAWINGAVLVVTTGRTLIKEGYLERLKSILYELQGVQGVVVFDQVSANPRLLEAEAAVDLGRKNKVTSVIGFGGGSSIDAAKAAAVGIAAEEPLKTFLFDGKEPGKSTLPIIAIPTTAGTGSELSRGAILSSLEHHKKSGIRGRYIQPKVAVVDPIYTWSVPFKTTMETGFDVIAHGVESFMAVKSNYYSEMISEKAIRIVGESLPLLAIDLNNHIAREAMSYASMIVGMNLATVGTCLPHRMQYAIGSLTDSSHGAGLASLYPSWIKYQYEVNHDKVCAVIDWLTGHKVDNGTDAYFIFKEYMKKLHLGYSMKDLGIKKTQLQCLAKMVEGNLANDLLSTRNEMIEQIFEESY